VLGFVQLASRHAVVAEAETVGINAALKWQEDQRGRKKKSRKKRTLSDKEYDKDRQRETNKNEGKQKS
jgi:hypothetical protein